MEQAGLIDLLFGDETGFSLEPNVPYGWLPIGRQTSLPSEHKRVGNVFGLLSCLGRSIMHWTTQNINSAFVVRCLDALAEKTTKPTVVVLDCAPWHTADVVKQRIVAWQQRDLYLFYLPPYSPQLNLIEILWRKIKYEWLEPKDFTSKDTLKDALLSIFQQYGTQFQINFSKNVLLSV